MKITQDVVLFESMKVAHAYLVLGQEITLIDTGIPGSWRTIVKGLENLSIRPSMITNILITHHDVDHIGSAAKLQELTGAELWASQEDIPVIMGEEERPGFKKHLKHIFRLKKPAHMRAILPQQTIGGIRAIPTPGHTKGHLCFLYKDILFAGDLFENKEDVLVPLRRRMNWDMDRLMQSIRAVANMPFRLICPAHGKPVERGNLLDAYLK